MIDHALNLPEIVFQLGLAVTALKTKSFSSFNDLLACMRVNRLWHRTMLPILWMAVDYSETGHLTIPADAIEAHSSLIRYLHINKPWPSTVLPPTHLRELDLGYVGIQTATELTCANPQLKSLKIVCRHGVENNLAAILKPLLQLQELHLISFNGHTVDQIIILASRLPELLILALEGSHGIGQGDATQPLPDLSITELRIESDWNKNSGMARVVRYCPNLESFQFRTFNNDGAEECPVAELVSDLREFCPKLKSLRNSPTRSDFYRLRPTEDDIVHLLHATDSLVYFDLPIEDLGARVCQALLDPHALFLETVQINVKTSNERVFVGVNRILASCPNLRSFTLSHHADIDESMPENGLALFAEPWICQRLERLVLDGFRVYKSAALRGRMGSVLLAQLDQQEEEGRHVARPGAPGNAVRTIKRSLHYLTQGELIPNQWTRALTFHPAPDPEFYNKLVRHGWGMVQKEGYRCSPLESAERDSSRLEKIVQDKVFERVFAMANVREVTLQNCQFRRTSSQEWTAVRP